MYYIYMKNWKEFFMKIVYIFYIGGIIFMKEDMVIGLVISDI